MFKYDTIYVLVFNRSFIPIVGYDNLTNLYLLTLQDQYDTIASHTQKGIDFCERFTHFLKDRCAIELKYASELK